jgi:hypothetical protein
VISAGLLIKSQRLQCPNTCSINLLSSGAAISPDIPGRIKPLLLPQPSDIGRRDALVIAIIPFPDVFGDLNLSLAFQTVLCTGAMGIPGQLLLQSEVEQLKGPLGSLARRNITVARR